MFPQELVHRPLGHEVGGHSYGIHQLEELFPALHARPVRTTAGLSSVTVVIMGGSALGSTYCATGRMPPSIEYGAKWAGTLAGVPFWTSDTRLAVVAEELGLV